ncbi:glutamate ABC transporter substrate-binding protein [Actinomadura madurae]|uniref:glutamate ABC transporter substrate-binding protein n=1 Tax=Actinomadura madurae TaxID=1993 RepID=UPI000D95A0DA|nr:glutamate ABC transporter substrate-binding protein [Actinomadura madurae]MCP9967119.1 glutamate ABC transporter substrate-binding protein [Actinomadura madurae]MCQ0008886.1 glutamate ABC transporter substrate-binding protein [Actinomadura madurae]URM95893.1 glutamate ABC transporter substrate-binding protein [Actinomadura madurae]URN06590.1 glutamate ABC transporter substrate-binding protein [Actinomadura madurae]SPT50576.1 Sulfate starvation-induced protein 7 [Actinomadura madurae]
MVAGRVLAAVVLVSGVLTACGQGGRESLLDKSTLVVGVRPDLPGLGLRHPDGRFEGFDIDVARYVAGRLGKKVRFVQVLAAERIPSLTSGRADLVFATLSVTPERKTRIAFAGPYYMSYQDVLVRTDERDVKGVRDLKGRRFCAVEGADPMQRLLAMHGMTARTVPARSYDECMNMIKGRSVDAITTNDVILAGLIRREGRGYRLVNARISEQNTGIGLRKGDTDGCEALNRAITRMYQDGTAAKLMNRWFGGTGLDLSIIEVPQFEGCV